MNKYPRFMHEITFFGLVVEWRCWRSYLTATWEIIQMAREFWGSVTFARIFKNLKSIRDPRMLMTKLENAIASHKSSVNLHKFLIIGSLSVGHWSLAHTHYSTHVSWSFKWAVYAHSMWIKWTRSSRSPGCCMIRPFFVRCHGSVIKYLNY